jgi:ABC-type cobalamin/Fe3+-siderophores transport system ATPase subunit
LILRIGPSGSGKTTLLHKIVRMHPKNMFSFILDGMELLSQNGLPPVNLPCINSMIVTTTTLDIIPIHFLEGALILRTPDIRN